ncbi:hypothetical protein Tco_0722113, partial [Tanacetum coccineum]
AFEEENVKDENLHGMDKEFETRLDGTLGIRSRSWLPRFRELKRKSGPIGVMQFCKRGSGTLVIPLDEIQINDTLHFIEEHVEIMDVEGDQEVSYCKGILSPIVKVQLEIEKMVRVHLGS